MRAVALALVAAIGCGSNPPKDDAEVLQLRQRVAELEREVKELQTARTRQLADQRAGIKLDLPSSAQREIDPATPSLVIILDAEGRVTVAGKPMLDDNLDNLFRAAFTRDKTTQVIIKADRGAGHGKVVEIMEKAKQAGLTRLAIGTASTP